MTLKMFIPCTRISTHQILFLKCVKIEDRRSMVLNMIEHKHNVNLDSAV